MQLTVQVNNGMIAEHVECGDVIISGEGVRKDEKGDTTVNVNEDLSMAMRVFVEAGLLTEDFQPNGISNPEASYIASCISQRLWLSLLDLSKVIQAVDHTVIEQDG